MTSKTTIPLRVETRERLKEMGRKGETYDEIIERLLNEIERKSEEDKKDKYRWLDEETEPAKDDPEPEKIKEMLDRMRSEDE